MSLKVSVENTSSLGRRLSIDIPKEQVSAAIEEKYEEMSRSKTIQLDGFRPGKVKKPVIQQRFKKKVHQEVLSALVEKSLENALKLHDLKPAGRPVLESLQHEENTDLQCALTFEIFPEIVLRDFSSLEVERASVALQEADIDAAIDKLRNQLAEWINVERAAIQGDRLTIDFKGTIDGKAFEHNEGEGVPLEIGSGQFIEGFEAGLIGASKGETLSLDLVFPDDWRAESMAGKLANFIITVKEISEKILPPLDEKFAQKIGAKGDDLEAIRVKVASNLQAYVERLVFDKTKNSLFEALLIAYDIELPQAVVQREIAALHEDLHRRMGNDAHGECHHDGLDDEARKRAALGLLMNACVIEYGLKPDTEKVRLKIQEMARSFGNGGFVENMYYESPELLASIQNAVLIDQAVDLILSRAHIKERAYTFDELLKGQ